MIILGRSSVGLIIPNLVSRPFCMSLRNCPSPIFTRPIGVSTVPPSPNKAIQFSAVSSISSNSSASAVICSMISLATESVIVFSLSDVPATVDSGCAPPRSLASLCSYSCNICLVNSSVVNTSPVNKSICPPADSFARALYPLNTSRNACTPPFTISSTNSNSNALYLSLAVFPSISICRVNSKNDILLVSIS